MTADPSGALVGGPARPPARACGAPLFNDEPSAHHWFEKEFGAPSG